MKGIKQSKASKTPTAKILRGFDNAMWRYVRIEAIKAGMTCGAWLAELVRKEQAK